MPRTLKLVVDPSRNFFPLWLVKIVSSIMGIIMGNQIVTINESFMKTQVVSKDLEVS